MHEWYVWFILWLEHKTEKKDICNIREYEYAYDYEYAYGTYGTYYDSVWLEEHNRQRRRI